MICPLGPIDFGQLHPAACVAAKKHFIDRREIRFNRIRWSRMLPLIRSNSTQRKKSSKLRWALTFD